LKAVELERREAESKANARQTLNDALKDLK
jgi:hypothetical protein